jgi:hypothetical protein
MASIQVLHAYRHLYRQGLRAVQFSKPARYVLRDRLREGFRDRSARFEPDSIARTLQFFEAATRTSGLEHKVLKNLLHVAFSRHQPISMKIQTIRSKVKYDKQELPVLTLQLTLPPF